MHLKERCLTVWGVGSKSRPQPQSAGEESIVEELMHERSKNFKRLLQLCDAELAWIPLLGPTQASNGLRRYCIMVYATEMRYSIFIISSIIIFQILHFKINILRQMKGSYWRSHATSRGTSPVKTSQMTEDEAAAVRFDAPANATNFEEKLKDLSRLNTVKFVSQSAFLDVLRPFKT